MPSQSRTGGAGMHDNDDIRALRAAICSLGAAMGPAIVGRTRELYQPFHAQRTGPEMRAWRDMRYGPDERNRLNIFAPHRQDGPLPVMVFVHGGGFVQGDTTLPDTPYYDNFGAYAVDAGMIGVVLTYRLAPWHVFPSARDDLGQAVEWLRHHIAGYWGDADRIILVGSSAGASCVADHVLAGGDPGVAGIVLCSGIYHLAALPDGGVRQAMQSYYGPADDGAKAASLAGCLAATGLPTMIVAAEFDIPAFREQSAALAGLLAAAPGARQTFVMAGGHNHYSIDFAYGTVDQGVGRRIADFARQGL